jgi:hypothetical protein
LVTLPSTSTVLLQSVVGTKVIRLELTRSGNELAERSSRRSSGSSRNQMGPRPGTRRRPALRRQWDGMLDLLLEIVMSAIFAEDGGKR